MVDVNISTIDIMVYTKYKKFSVKGWQSLKPYSIAIARGFPVTAMGTKNMEVSLYDSTDKLLELVNNDKYDLTLLSRIDGLVFLNTLNMSDIRRLEPPVATVYLYHYLHKKHKLLIPEITASLLKMKENGRIKAIYDQFIAELKPE